MPAFRQLFAICLIWAFLTWLAAAGLSIRITERALSDALTWYYSVRAPVVGSAIAGIFAPLLCMDVGKQWIEIVYPHRKKLAQFMMRNVQGGVLGLLIGVIGTFCLLYIWPNDMQNQRSDAWKWTVYYWTVHRSWMLASTLLMGAISSQVAAALKQDAL